MILLNQGDKEIVFSQNGRFLEFYKRNSPLMYKYDLSTNDFFCFKRSDESQTHRSSSEVKRWFRGCKIVTDDQKLYTMFKYGQQRCPDNQDIKSIMQLFRTDGMSVVEKWAALGMQLIYNRGWGTRNYVRETDFYIEYAPADVPNEIRTYAAAKTWTITELNRFLNTYHDADDIICQIFDSIMQHPEYESAFIKVIHGTAYNYLHDHDAMEVLHHIITDFNLRVPRLMIYLHYLNEMERIDVAELLGSYESYLIAELEKCNGKKNKMFKYPNHFKSIFYTQQEILRREQELANYDLSNDAAANQYLEYADDDFMIIVPKNPEDVQDEGRQQGHCIAQAYLNHIACGDTVCVFMRRTSEPDKSLITIEIRNGVIRQACIGRNHTVPYEYREWIEEWAAAKDVRIDADSWSTTLAY